ncbi:D-2-hydroxyacid dehydrogenase [Bacillus sp. H-16]|uniref:D-2-hydroxyacid dehydrogenase n=1 Tax=Alteribacter salitolerans TaxID=2912333 RepID=UPI0019652B69|nr:D-2-hydroxyacid dehydrogenase [Alteribacter salitolerans]MBM7097768.1 D-2-hydroxyacid dehydrogenase [Alteribacter salitolerans]
MKVVTTAKIRRDLREELPNLFPEVTFSFNESIDEAEKDLPYADILLTYGEDLTDDHIVQARNLKWIMVISAGMEKMPFDAIAKKDILITNARGIHATPMAEYTLAMMLQVSRHAKGIIEQEQNEVWSRKLTMTELKGKTIGVLGAGAIGSEIARLAKAFGMTAIGLNRSGRPVDHFDTIITFKDLNQLLNQSDYVVSVLPHTDETDGMLTTGSFKAMKKEAIFINIGRGTVAREDVLLQALQNKEISHAVLDVFEEEPLPKGHPFWKTDRITVTPHISGISPEYQPRALEIFKNNLKVFTGGGTNYQNKVDPSKGY